MRIASLPDLRFCGAFRDVLQESKLQIALHPLPQRPAGKPSLTVAGGQVLMAVDMEAFLHLASAWEPPCC